MVLTIMWRFIYLMHRSVKKCLDTFMLMLQILAISVSKSFVVDRCLFHFLLVWEWSWISFSIFVLLRFFLRMLMSIIYILHYIHGKFLFGWKLVNHKGVKEETRFWGLKENLPLFSLRSWHVSLTRFWVCFRSYQWFSYLRPRSVGPNLWPRRWMIDIMKSVQINKVKGHGVRGVDNSSLLS